MQPRLMKYAKGSSCGRTLLAYAHLRLIDSLPNDGYRPKFHECIVSWCFHGWLNNLIYLKCCFLIDYLRSCNSRQVTCAPRFRKLCELRRDYPQFCSTDLLLLNQSNWLWWKEPVSLTIHYLNCVRWYIYMCKNAAKFPFKRELRAF